MKTTNTKTSKKLKKAGYVGKTDLETLIEALPKTIEFKKKEYCFWMQWSGSSNCLLIGYVNGNLRAVELEVWQEENESLADTAGRLLIELFEAGIINFKK